MTSRNRILWSEIGKWIKNLFRYRDKSKDYLLYAKVEYGNDWRYVYDHLQSTGKTPGEKKK